MAERKLTSVIQNSCAFLSRRPSATVNLGKRVGEKLEAGSIVALIGELGCGKTLFTRGICVGLGVPERQVNSPTFAFVNEYRGRLPIFHIDLYRLDNIAEELGIGILDYLVRGKSGVIVVEWAEKMLSLLPDEYLQVNFEVVSPRQRQLVLTGFGERFTRWIAELNKR